MKKIALIIVIIIVLSTYSSHNTRPDLNQIEALEKIMQRNLIEENEEIITWMDVVKLNDILYTGMHDYVIASNEYITDIIVGEVEFKMAGVVTHSSYQIQGGDAAYLEIGTKLYHVKGYEHDEIIAAPDEHSINGYRLYKKTEPEHNHLEKYISAYMQMSKEKVHSIEVFKLGGKEPISILNGGESQQFIAMLEEGMEGEASTSERTISLYNMVFYTDESLAYKYVLYDDGEQVYFYTHEKRVVNEEIRKWLTK